MGANDQLGNGDCNQWRDAAEVVVTGYLSTTLTLSVRDRPLLTKPWQVDRQDTCGD